MTLDELKQNRLAGMLPCTSVTIWLDDEYQHLPKAQEIILGAKVNVDRLDLRPLVGLSVFIHAERYTDRLARLYRRLQEYAAFIMVAIIDFGDELGWKWTRLHGEVAL